MKIRSDTAKEVIDLLAFILVTPDLIGTERLGEFTQLAQDLYSRASVDPNLSSTISSAFSAAMIIVLIFVLGRYGPRFRGRILVYWVGASLITFLAAVLIAQMALYFKGTTTTRLMLLAGAMLFFANRVMGIYLSIRSHGDNSNLPSMATEPQTVRTDDVDDNS
jgi:hypothetical protein